jgi:hypothetical protein
MQLLKEEVREDRSQSSSHLGSFHFESFSNSQNHSGSTLNLYKLSLSLPLKRTLSSVRFKLNFLESFDLERIRDLARS